MTFESFKDKKIAVMGLGVSNTPLVKLLHADGCDVTACDRSENPDGYAELAELGVSFRLGKDYLDCSGYDVIFRTPGMRPDLPEFEQARERGAVITSEMELFFELCPCPIIAITGSDGKTTTTTIISELLRAAGYTVHLGGNIGNPLLPEVDSIEPEDYAVVELSSFQLMSMKQSADIAVITNIAPNHLDYHKSMEEYIQAKMNVFLHQKPGSRLVLNADNEITSAFAPNKGVELFTFSMKEQVPVGIYCENGSVCFASGKKLLDTCDIFLPGTHNVENYMAAFCAVGDIVGEEICRNVAKQFGGVEHRIEFVRKLDGVSYYNDSIASSPTRTIAALHSFDRKLILIAGGYDKNIPYDVLGPEITKAVKILILTGATAGKIKEAVENALGEQPEIIMEDDFRQAVLTAKDKAEDGDIVILSPASASFDKFKNFMQRGEYFKQIVSGL